MWAPSQQWVQGFTDVLNQANDIKKNKNNGSGFECFQIIFYAIHIQVLLIGLGTFIFGITGSVPIVLVWQIIENVNQHKAFLAPAILAIVTILFTVMLLLQCTREYQRYLLVVYFLLVASTIVTCTVLWEIYFKMHVYAPEKGNIFDHYDKCLNLCKYHDS